MIETSLEFKVISRAETLKHNSINDCWLIIQNSIYDFTSFIKEHPGGSEILLSRAGEDATSFFLAKHGNSKAIIKRLERLKIGELPEQEKFPLEDLNEPFFLELLDKCYKAKLFNIPSTFKNIHFWVRAVSLVAFFTLFSLTLFAQLPIAIVLPMVVLQGIIGTSLFGYIAHENTHRNFPKNPILKGLLTIAWPIIWPFINQRALAYEHNSHHVKIGDVDYDFEVAGFSSVIRYSGQVESNPMHKYQHKFAKYIYPFYANIITTIGGAKSKFWSSHNRKMAFYHTVSLLWTFAVYILLPTLVTGKSWLWFLLIYGIYQCVLYYGIYVGAAINHFVPQVTKEIPEQYKNSYGYYICHNTTNFCTNSKFWFWYTGGFNIQIEHHLLPFIPLENLKRLVPIVKELCEKYDYPYHNYKSVKDLWTSHYDYLFIMSQSDNNQKLQQEIVNKRGYTAR